MADNVELNAGTGGVTAAADDIAGIHYQRVKISWGVDGAAVDASASNPFPITSITLVPGTGATNLGKAEDAAHTTGDVGVMALGVRSDTPAALGADGDYMPPIFNSSGHLWTAAVQSGTWNITNVSGTVSLPTGASTAANQTTIIGHLDGVEGLLTTIDGDTGALAAALKAVDVAAGAADVGFPAILVRDDALATLTPVDGDYTHGRVNARGAQWVCLDSTAAQTVTLAAGTATNEVVGDAAHGAAVAGNPVLVGLEGRSTAPTAVDDGDVVRVLASLLGKQVVLPYALPANTWSYASAAAVTDTADDEVIAAVASTRHYITGIQVFNGHDTVGTEVVIKDGSTVKWRGWAEQTGGGCSAKFDPPLRGTANTAVNVANITNSSSTYYNLQGYSAAE